MTAADETQVRLCLEQWATATRKGQRDAVLANHLPDVLIYDVLAPMKRASLTRAFSNSSVARAAISYTPR